MELRVTRGPAPEDGAVVVLVGLGGILSDAARELDERSGGLVRRALALEGSGAKHGKVLHLLLPAGLPYPHLLVAVVGKEGGPTPLEIEEVGGAVVQRLRGLKVKRAALGGTRGLDLPFSPEEAAARLAAGALLQAYRFEKYRSQADEEDKPVELEALEFLADGEPDALEGRLAQIRAVARAVARTRDLVTEPANALGPAELAAACRELEPLGVEVDVLDGPRLEELGMRALLAVGQGSARPPLAVVMRWRGAEGDPLALVGKGVCFDSGGISIKPSGGMEDMKWDMAGAGAVFGAMMALAGRKARAHVVGLVGLAENMPSGTATRPGDVVRAASGTTIEVVNTDAEGRMVLADVLWYAKEHVKPAGIVDLATLTGAIIVALGHERAGLFATDETLATRLTEVGETVGERLWRMPLGKEYGKHIKSDIADIKNVGRARQAGATAGAVFLQRFVGDLPWAHLDIAGVAWSGRDTGLAPKGATAFGVRLLDRLVAEHYEAG